ncbi:MAG: ATP synthase F1 subunit gamma [Bacteroidaceae bacterium]|nr:ATP synthase F1 subunit gamma [Bacteroidaceae bacterium]
MSLKEVKQRIQSVKNTQKITSAMKMISAAKLRRAQNAIESVRPYKEKLYTMLLTYLSAAQEVKTPYTRIGAPRHVAIVAVSSDSSLCGSFNATIIRRANEVVDEYLHSGCETVEVFPVGKKMAEALRKSGLPLDESLMQQAGSPHYNDVSRVAYHLMERFAAGSLDRIELVYTHFHSAARHIPMRETFLPMDVTNIGSEAQSLNHDFIVEPDKERLIEALLPRVTAMRLFTALLDSVAAEHAARMLAMQIATDNADDLITTLVREYNKSRQQAITNELLDIVSGSLN